MKARLVRFGEIELGGERYDRDVVVERGKVRRRHKRASKPFRAEFGHTPLTLQEPIPWQCRKLIVGIGVEGRLPILDDVRAEAARRGVELIVVPTEEACRLLSRSDEDDTAAVLHVTC